MFFFFQAEDGIRDATVTGVQTCALPISRGVERADVDGHGDDAAGDDLRAVQDSAVRAGRRLAPRDVRNRRELWLTQWIVGSEQWAEKRPRSCPSFCPLPTAHCPLPTAPHP